MKRAIGLLEYARREAEATVKAQKGGTAELETNWQPLDEKQAENQFSLAQMMIPPNMLERSGGIPEYLREAIRWAEAEKAKRGIN